MFSSTKIASTQTDSIGVAHRTHKNVNIKNKKMTNPEMSESISRTEFEIATLQAQIDQLQERHDLLKAAEAMRGSVLWKLEQAIALLNEVSPNQVAVFKFEVEAKFATSELIAPEMTKVIPVPEVFQFSEWCRGY